MVKTLMEQVSVDLRECEMCHFVNNYENNTSNDNNKKTIQQCDKNKNNGKSVVLVGVLSAIGVRLIKVDNLPATPLFTATRP